MASALVVRARMMAMVPTFACVNFLTGRNRSAEGWSAKTGLSMSKQRRRAAGGGGGAGGNGDDSRATRAARGGITEMAQSGNLSPLLEDEIPDAGDFVEVGYIADTHGVNGELHVHSLTDFPEERFEKPGTRWIRSRSMGKPVLQRVELVEGRERSGRRPSWLITLNGFDTLEKASELVGSTMLVTDRPSLDEDEFYIPDLVGMSVALQETGQEIGVVLDVFNTGGDTDLLQVSLTASAGGSSDRKVWIPFVKDIVPIVDKHMRRVEITPPAGLLELNAPGDGKDVKAKRKQEVKEKRKLKERFAGLKKKLTAIGQTHILDGLSTGSEAQQQELMEQLLTMDFALFQLALQDALPLSNSSVRPQENAVWPEPPSAFPRVSCQDLDTWLGNPRSLEEQETGGDDVDVVRWWQEGLQLVADGRVGVVVLAGGQSTRLGHTTPLVVKGMLDLGLPEGKSIFEIQAERLLIIQELAALVTGSGTRPHIPWIVMTSDATDKSTRSFFAENKFFGLKEDQVWFLMQESMPCIGLEKRNGQHRILMETPWKVARAPNGNGGLFSALHGQGMLDRLIDLGVDYLQVFAVDNALVRVADPVFFGYTKECDADIGVKVVTKISPEEAMGVVCRSHDIVGSAEDTKVDEGEGRLRYGVLEYSEIPDTLRSAVEDSGEPESSLASHEGLDSISKENALKFRAGHTCMNIFSVDFLKKLGDGSNELKFHTALKRIPHVEMEDGEWKQVVPEKPNGVKLERFIFDAFKFSDPDKVVLLEVVREEEFAPVKNATGPGVPDSVDTAQRLLLSMKERLVTLSSSEPKDPRKQLLRRLCVAYLTGYIEGDIAELLDLADDEQLSS